MRSIQEAQIVLGDDDLLGVVAGIRSGRRCRRARVSPASQLLGTELLGRSFLSRMASRTARGVRKASHVALNVGAKIPGYGAAVDMFRSVTGGKGGGGAPGGAGGGGGGGAPEEKPLWQNPMVLVGGALVLVMLLKKSGGGGGGSQVQYVPVPAAAPAGGGKK